MSTSEPNRQASSAVGTVNPQKSIRVLACVSCQQRKIKCDRKFPCGNCIKSHSKCVPATALAPRQRRRRFPERELLDRLRRYEGLLRNNNIKFEPLHRDLPTEGKTSPTIHGEGQGSDSAEDESPTATMDKEPMSPMSQAPYETKSIWHAMIQEAHPREPRDDSSDSSPGTAHEAAMKNAWNEMYQTNDHLLFGPRDTSVELVTLHPEQVHIFRLWQIYIDNINPLIKVTHTPTLQGRIIDAASDLANVDSTFEALLFSIYCVSILSLSEDECQATFNTPRQQLLSKYQFGCRQALLNCGFLRTGHRDRLTALFLYLIAVRPGTDPESLSSMLAIAIRTGQRMGLHSESTNSRYPALEAELRRRLWWSLILFDARICELTDYRASTLIPTWDCKMPVNANDFDLQPEMRDPPVAQEKPTEALFSVMRSDVGQFVRHSGFHLDFISPALKAVARHTPSGNDPKASELVVLEKMIEEKYVRLCNPKVPLHYMTIWTARGQLARCRLLDYYSRFCKSSMPQTDLQRDSAVYHALSMLECDTKLMNSSLVAGYYWFVHFHFPFPAYIHICQDLRKRPNSDHAERCWETMSANYEARFVCLGQDDNPFVKVFSRTILHTWEMYEESFRQAGKPLMPPRIVNDIQQKLERMAQNTKDSNIGQPEDTSVSNSDFYTLMPLDSGGQSLRYGVGGLLGSGLRASWNTPWQAALNAEMDEVYWNPMNLTPMQGFGW